MKSFYEKLSDKNPNMFVNEDLLIVTDDQIDDLLELSFLDYEDFQTLKYGKCINIDWMSENQLQKVCEIILQKETA